MYKRRDRAKGKPADIKHESAMDEDRPDGGKFVAGEVRGRIMVKIV